MSGAAGCTTSWPPPRTNDHPTWTNGLPHDSHQVENYPMCTATLTSPWHPNVSSSSVGSSKSIVVRPLRVRNGNVFDSRTISSSTVEGTSSIAAISRKTSKQASHKSSWGTDIPLPPSGRLSPMTPSSEPFEDIDLDGERTGSVVRCWRRSKDIQSQDLSGRRSFETAQDHVSAVHSPSGALQDRSDLEPVVSDPNSASRPFRRWMSTLRRRKLKRDKAVRSREERWSLDDFNDTTPDKDNRLKGSGRTKHKKSSSWSSSGVVGAVRSAGMSLAALSVVAPTSRRTRQSLLKRSDNRSSGLSHSINRDSIGDGLAFTHIIDQAAWDRATQRRKTLEELIVSEESYIADLKVLVNVYLTLLSSASSISQRTMQQINCNITEILVLHEELLVHLQQTIHSFDTSPSAENANSIGFRSKPVRGQSVDIPRPSTGIGFSQLARHSLDISRFNRHHGNSLGSEPKEAAEVALVFGKMMSRFFVYEEYGARYESMLQDMTSTSLAIPNWQAYERGIEALANTLAPAGNREGRNKKGLTFGDLLIKPIQRICKYPLLFADLYKHTPVIDCPESHAELEKVLYRLRETAMEINKATNDQHMRAKIQRTWNLQDLLVFQDQKSSAPFAVRSLGHSTLCGVLHVTYQSKRGINGEYMLCAMFKSCLLLARPIVGTSKHAIVASIGFRDLRVETTDNGKGLQCHTALYSWKVVFESDQQLFELIFCACSPREEDQWTINILRRSAAEGHKEDDDRPMTPSLLPVLYLDLKPIGHVFGLPGTLARRISIQRAATVGARTNTCQVIIKNTHALQDNGDSSSTAAGYLGRSRSLLSTTRIPTLAPKRTDRIRMEQQLAHVWTRESLPYPGMGRNRGEHLIRASASSMMRRLSKASIASGLGRRSTSHTALSNGKPENLHERTKSLHDSSSSQRPGVLSYYSTNMAHDIPNSATISRGHVAPPLRASSALGIRPLKGNRLTRGRRGSEACRKVSLEFSDREMINDPTSKDKWSNPLTLVKAFSTEGIRSLFA